MPAELEVTATSEDGEIMAVQHRRHPVHGLQFHPESVLTEHGYRLVDHFLHGVPTSPRARTARGRWGAGARRARVRHAGLESAVGGSGAVIIESIVTSMAPDGSINFAPMGVEWGEERIVLKPFLETTTFRNVRETRVAVVNLTDDVMLFAQGAISSPQFPWAPATKVKGAVLEAACSWRELEVARSTIRRRARASRPAWCIRGSGASSSASTGRATRCSRPRSWPPAPT